MYYVYVLKSLQTGKYYKGFTKNINQRLKEHEQGKTQTTNFLRPFVMIHVEICSSLEEARILEECFQSAFGRAGIKETDAEVAELVYAQS